MTRGSSSHRRALIALFTVVLQIAWASEAAAQARGPGLEDEVRPVLPPTWKLHADGYWWPTVFAEKGSTRHSGPRTLDDTRLGLSLAYRRGVWGPHIRIAVSPNIVNYQNVAAMSGAGLRAHFSLFGYPVSWGMGAHVETRLRDSLWLVYGTPIELGVPFYRGRSAEFYVFFGARRAVHGELINSFLLDPNGYDNEKSREQLDILRHDRPWQLFVTLAFGRRVE